MEVSEKLIIKNFGPLKNIDIEIKNINLFIGPQGSGKSTLAKLITILKGLSIRIAYSDIKLFIEQLKNYEIEQYLTLKTTIVFENRYIHLSIKNKKMSIDILDSLDEVEGVMEKMRLDSIKFNNSLEEIEKYQTEKKLNSDEIRKIINKLEDDMEEFKSKYINHDFARHIRTPLYIPAERNLISIISDALFDFVKHKINLPSYILDFGTLYTEAREKVKEISINFLGIKYSYFRKQDWVLIPNKKIKISLKKSASGFQSILPLIVIIEKVKMDNNVNRFFVIEEPELNLYPTSQYGLIKYLFDGPIKDVSSFIITTHSPYVLASVDNLIQANNAYLSNKNKQVEIKKIIPKDNWVGFEKVSAYQIENGVAVDIKNYEEKSIGANKIDTVSEEIGKDFENLLRIRYAN